MQTEVAREKDAEPKPKPVLEAVEEQKEEVALAKAAEAPKEGAAEAKAEAVPKEVKQVPEVAVAETAEGPNEEAEDAKTEASAPPVQGAEAGNESKMEEAAETRQRSDTIWTQDDKRFLEWLLANGT